MLIYEGNCLLGWSATRDESRDGARRRRVSWRSCCPAHTACQNAACNGALAMSILLKIPMSSDTFANHCRIPCAMLQDTGIRDISVAADTFEHKPFRPIKSTRQRIENQRAHDAALKERHERLKEIEELARKRAKFEVSHIPSDVEVSGIWNVGISSVVGFAAVSIYQSCRYVVFIDTALLDIPGSHSRSKFSLPLSPRRCCGLSTRPLVSNYSPRWMPSRRRSPGFGQASCIVWRSRW